VYDKNQKSDSHRMASIGAAKATAQLKQRRS